MSADRPSEAHGGDERQMSPPPTTGGDEIEFFGVKLRVNDPRLAALLDSDVTEDVQVVGRRAREALSRDDDARAQRDVEQRLRRDDEPVTIRSKDDEKE